MPFQQLRPSQASLAETMPPEPQGYPKMGRAHVLRSLFDSCLVGQAAIAICVHGPVEGLHLLGRWRRTGAGAVSMTHCQVFQRVRDSTSLLSKCL